MESPSADRPSSSKDAQDLPEWAEWPLKSNGRLDGKRLMPTTYRVCSEEYSKNRQDLASSIPILPPKRDKETTKSVPFINNLTLLEYFDLAGEEVGEFRSFILETLGESDRIDNGECLLSDDAAIKRSMAELRRVANEIHQKKSREQSRIFLQKRANLAILGYFTRQDPRNLSPPYVPSRMASFTPPRVFNEFLTGNRGAARVSLYNWRHKKWERSVAKNLSFKKAPQSLRRVTPISVKRKLAPVPENIKKDIIAKEKSAMEGMPTLTAEDNTLNETTVASSSSKVLSDPSATVPLDDSPNGKKRKMINGFTVANAVMNGREEVNFFCAVKANKVHPSFFGMPKGFIKYGDKIVHHTKTDKVGVKRRTISNQINNSNPVDSNDGTAKVKTDLPIKMEEDSDDGVEVVMEDIEDDDDCGSQINPNDTTTEESKSAGLKVHAETQTFEERNEEDSDIVKHLNMLKSAHSEDISTIRMLRSENASALRNLNKFHDKFMTVMIERNNLKCSLNIIEKEKKGEKLEMQRMNQQIKSLTQQNETLRNEVNALRREIAIRDQLAGNHVEVARYEEFTDQ